MQIAVLDAGTSSLRASLVDETLRIRAVHQTPTPYLASRPGESTFDPDELARRARELLEAVAADTRVDGVAITNQRASAVLFDRNERRALAPGIGWDDARTAARCLALNAAGIPTSPSESATKFEALLTAANVTSAAHVGTIDAWLLCALTREGEASTDPTNAAVTGLTDATATAWDPERLRIFGLDEARLVPILPSIGPRAHVALGGRDVPVLVVIGDQQAAHAGHRATTKLTIGTSAVADAWLGLSTPPVERRGPEGTFPVVLVDHDRSAFGLEAFWPSAGTTVRWLGDLGIVGDADATEHLARRASGAVPTVVPTLSGAGAPLWDFGARGVIRNIRSTTGRAEIAAGVLEGLAHVGATLLDALWSACRAVTGAHVSREVGLDGRAGHNPVVAGLLATLLDESIELSSSPEATTLGAARLALGLSRQELPRGRRVHPGTHAPTTTHAAWLEALAASQGAVPALSALRF